MDLSVTSDRLPDGTVEVTPRGEVDLDNAYEIRAAVDAALLGPRPAGIRVHLGLVTLIDSVGIGVLVGCFHAAAASGVPLIVREPSPLVYRQLWVAGLVGLFGFPEPSTNTVDRVG